MSETSKIRSEEQEVRLRELADKVPVRVATEADQDWLDKARLEVARIAVQDVVEEQ